MAIEDIFRALEEQADDEVSAILRAAQVQADAMVQEARDEADRITQARVQAAEDSVKARSAKSVNAARLQVRRDLAAVRDEAVDRVFELAAERLAALRGSAEYEGVFRGLVSEAVEGVQGACELVVAPDDAALAEKVVADLGATCTVASSLEGIGGAVVSYDGGRIVRRNTFESRLEKVRGLAQSKVAEVLTS
ncbi:MAG: V-type ATP synthase subunit E [Coriobacteriia bacterium]|nr:V-type ATP synthase subunit E [Coriobacteriia bacterium]